MDVKNILANNYGISNMLRSNQSAIKQIQSNISTGKRINTGADSPSEIGKVQRFTSLIRGRDTAKRNIQEGISLIHTADSVLDTSEELGLRLRDLAVRYNNGTVSSSEKSEIEEEARAICKEMNSNLKNAKFGDIDIFSKNKYSIQTGPNSGDIYEVKMPAMKNLQDLLDDVTLEIPDNQNGSPIENPGEIPDAPPSNIKNIDISRYYAIEIDDKRFSGMLKFDNVRGESNIYDVSGIVGLSGYTGTLEFAEGGINFNIKSILGEKISGSIDLFYADNKNLHGVATYTDKGVNRQVDISLSSSGMKIGNQSVKIGSEKGQSSMGNGREGSDAPVAPESRNLIHEVSEESPTEVSPMSFLLNAEFIDKNILNTFSSARTSLGISEQILDSRYKYQSSQVVVDEEALSNIESLDYGKALMELTKKQMLQEPNLNLFSNNLDSHRSYIAQLLR